MITLTGWNGRPVYVAPGEIAAIEPVSATDQWLRTATVNLATVGIEAPAGSVITLAAGRSIYVTEEAETVHALTTSHPEPIEAAS